MHLWVISTFWPSSCISLLYLPLQRTQTSRFSINSSISEPQAGWNMLNEAHGLSILDLRCSHAFHISLLGHFNFLLYFELKVHSSLRQAKEVYTTQHNSERDNFADNDLWNPEAEGWHLGNCLLRIHQQQSLLFIQIKVPARRYVTYSERLPPLNVASAPTANRHKQMSIRLP